MLNSKNNRSNLSAVIETRSQDERDVLVYINPIQFSGEDSINELLIIGAKGFIPEPYRMSELCSIVNKVINSM